jgi:hypothetical protein
MGEYFVAVCPDLKEYIDFNAIGHGGIKLSCFLPTEGNDTSNLILFAITAGGQFMHKVGRGRWAGHRVIIAGDENRYGKVYHGKVARKAYRDVTAVIVKSYRQAFGDSSIHLHKKVQPDYNPVGEKRYASYGESCPACQKELNEYKTMTVETKDPEVKKRLQIEARNLRYGMRKWGREL